MQLPRYRAEASIQFPEEVPYRFQNEEKLINGRQMFLKTMDSLGHLQTGQFLEEELREDFRSNIDVFGLPSERLISIGFTSMESEEASKICNAITRVYLEVKAEFQADTLTAKLSGLGLIVIRCEDAGVREVLRVAYNELKESIPPAPPKLKLVEIRPATKIGTDWITLFLKSIRGGLQLAGIVILTWLMFANSLPKTHKRSDGATGSGNEW